MKQALILGGGSENGRAILETLIDNNFSVINVGSSQFDHAMVTNIHVRWNQLTVDSVYKIFNQFDSVFDFVFFNHNSSSLAMSDFDLDHDDVLKKWRLIKDWSRSHWLSCEMPFLILHTIRHNLDSRSKVGWMLSNTVEHGRAHSRQYPDYSSNKFFNYQAMRCFGEVNQFKTFGIYPDFAVAGSRDKLKSIVTEIVQCNTLLQQEFKF
jgi:hypothetical protein